MVSGFWNFRPAGNDAAIAVFIRAMCSRSMCSWSSRRHRAGRFPLPAGGFQQLLAGSPLCEPARAAAERIRPYTRFEVLAFHGLETKPPVAADILPAEVCHVCLGERTDHRDGTVWPAAAKKSRCGGLQRHHVLRGLWMTNERLERGELLSAAERLPSSIRIGASLN